MSLLVAFPVVSASETLPRFGLWQTVGNVWEWCAGWFSSRYYAQLAAAADPVDPTGPVHGLGWVMRGMPAGSL